jgi:hypothetical protein
MTTTSPSLEPKSPTLFTAGTVVITSMYGLILMVPVLVSMMIVTVLQFGFLTVLIPLGAIVLVSFFLPLGFGNSHITRLVQPLQPESPTNQENFVVQLTRNPRTRSGLSALLEDADDLGVLSLTDSAIIFNGDSLRLTVPYDSVRNLKQLNSGARGLFAYGGSTSFSVAGLSQAGEFKFAERSSLLLPTSRKTAKRMYQGIKSKADAASQA